jgi:hypothetical protein
MNIMKLLSFVLKVINREDEFIDYWLFLFFNLGRLPRDHLPLIIDAV